MPRSIAIIGDRFMLPSVFAERIAAACGDGRQTSAPLSNPGRMNRWSTATQARRSMVSRSIWVTRMRSRTLFGDAAILVTHLAPISRPMLERLPGLKFVAVSRGGPVNIDLEAARDRNVLRRQYARPQCERSCGIHDRRHPCRDAPYSQRPRSAPRAANGAAISIAPIARGESLAK